MKRRVWISRIAFALTVGMTLPALAQLSQPHASATASAAPYRFKAAGEGIFEWFFLLVDAGKEQGIWATNGLEPEFVPVAGSSVQLRERIDAGIQIGFVNTAEVTLARASGVPVKTVAGYFGETTARIFVAANGPIKAAKDLDGKKIGIVAATHTSYRTVLYMNKKLAIKADPVPLGTLGNNVAALKSGEIDAFYSAEGAALTLVDSGELRLLLPLSDIYPKPYTAVVVWTTSDLIEQNPDLVARFVKATLETVAYLKAHPSYASDLYIRRTKAPRNVADRAVASLNQVLASSGRGSRQDLAAAVAGNWQFITESGAVPASAVVKIEEVVDARFLPRQ
ncbi:MAG TPA: ABC transporter substrate-binding protein [Verrucomicrobiae bacterium]|jgi:NitT/TauT family transport system substrate-binding protein|nr:ABC transporter substrate-binding protein [Verrucomicrobiae bacterium]